MLIKILSIGILTVILSAILKQYKSDFSLLINICGGVLILFLLLNGLSEIVNEIKFIGEEGGISQSVIRLMIKTIVVAYLIEFCVDIAEDSGNKFLASKILIGGKVAICVMAFPIIKLLFQTIISLI